MKNIAIIPARSGSKGLKDKNIINLMGKPMIAYTIQAAIDSGCFDSVYVSTDSLEYAELSQKYGAKTIIRDYALSDDNATTYMVIEHALNFLNSKDIQVNTFALLQPTSPLRNSQHIQEAYKLFVESQTSIDFVVSVTESSKSRNLIHTIEDGTLAHFDSNYKNYKRQEYQEYYPNGAMFFGKTLSYIEKGDFFGPKSIPYVMAAKESIDVDTVLDFKHVIGILDEDNIKREEPKKILHQISEKAKNNDRDSDILFFGHSVLNDYRDITFRELSVSNWGINGSTSKDMYFEVIKKELISFTHKKIFVMLGVNDIKKGMTIDDSKCYLNKIVSYFIKSSQKSNIVLAKVMHNNGNIYVSNDKIDEFNKMIDLLAEKYNIKTFSWKAFENHFGKVYYEYSKDGTHLTDLGYKLMEKEFFELFQKEE